MKTMRGFSLALFLASSVGAFAQSVQFILVDRREAYQQTDATTLANTGPLDFRVSLENVTNANLITSASFTSPGGSGVSGGTLTTDPNSSDSLRYSSTYTQDANGLNSLFSDFGAGTYTVSVANSNGTVNVPISQLGAGNFPNSSLISVSISGGHWLNGSYYFDPSSGATLDLSTSYSGPGSSNHGDLSISGQNLNLDIGGGGVFNSSTMSWSVPTSNFVLGQSYDLELDWSNIASLATLSGSYDFLNGATAAGIFTTKTSVMLVAIPEPATTALVLTAIAALGVAARRRARWLAAAAA